MIFLFLDKYYITNSEDAFTVYALLKDFLVPILVLVATIRGSVWLSNREERKRLKLEQEQEDERNRTITGIIKLANENIIENLKNTEHSIEENISSLNFENFDDFSHPRFKKSQFNILLDIGYEKIYELAILERKIDPNKFVKYWSAISESKFNLEAVEYYNNYVTTEYNKLNARLNDVMEIISISTSDYVYSILDPNADNTIHQDRLKEPKMALAIECNRIRNVFYFNETDTYFAKAKHFLEELKKLNKHQYASKALSSEFAQHVIKAQHNIASFEKLFDIAKDVFEGYSNSINTTVQNIEDFQGFFIRKDK
jgi:hypothetical protein